MGNSDAHAKNISLLRPPDGDARLAPAYDVAMHAHHASYSGIFAMDVNGRSDMSGLSALDLISEGRVWGLPSRRADRAVRTTLIGLHEALTAVERRHHPGVSRQARSPVEDSTARLLASLGPAP